MNVKVRVMEKYKVIQCQGHINCKVQGDTNVKARVIVETKVMLAKMTKQVAVFLPANITRKKTGLNITISNMT